jgi:hypothetical protein
MMRLMFIVLASRFSERALGSYATHAGSLLQINKHAERFELSVARNGSSINSDDADIQLGDVVMCSKECEVSPETVQLLRNLTVPNYMACPEPEHVGGVDYNGSQDGSYIGCGADSYSGAEAVFSFGICGQDELGCELANRTGAHLFEYDCFNTRVPDCGEKIVSKRVFKENCLGQVTESSKVCLHGSGPIASHLGDAFVNDGCQLEKSASFQDIDTVLLEAGMQGSENLIMKVDIEGSEWKAFDAFTSEHWARVSTLFVELHLDQRGFPGLSFKKMSERYLMLLHKLNEHFTMVHLSGSGVLYMFGDLPVPSFQLVTFRNRRFLKQTKVTSSSLSGIMSKHLELEDAKTLGMMAKTEGYRAHYFSGF